MVHVGEFEGVEDVLPEDVAASGEGDEGMEEGGGQVDGEGCVFLEHALPRVDGLPAVAREEAADQVLNEAGEEGSESSNTNEE